MATINGTRFNDNLLGTIYADRIYGQGGNDVIGGKEGEDHIHGETGDDSLYGDEGNDWVYGGNGNDLVRGDWGGGHDVFGNDYVDGGNGNDALYGGSGNDTLIGGAGKDDLSGGTGKDRFDFNSVNESPAWGAIDTISDFKRWEGDKIDLSTIDANLNLAGNQAFNSSQLSYNSFTGVLTANVYWGNDLQVDLIGATGFNPSLDVVA